MSNTENGHIRMVKLIFYGPLADAIAREIKISSNIKRQTLGALRAHLATSYPDQAGLLCGPRTRWALDGEFADDHASLEGVALAECLPPVSGG